MTIAELYKLPVMRSTRDVAELLPRGSYYNQLPELEQIRFSGEFLGNTRVEIRYHDEQWTDQRRFWRVGSVWLDGEPVMAIQNAGREGDDWRRRFITNPILYRDLVQYLTSLFVWDSLDIDSTERASADQEIATLTAFYGSSLGAAARG